MADPLGDDLAEFAAERATSGSFDDAAEQTPPENADDANRMLRWLRSLERQAAEIADRADAERALVDVWQRDRTAGIDRQIERLSKALEGWMRGQFEMRGTTTEKLPAGDLWLRGGQTSVVTTSDAELVPWLVRHGLEGAVQVTESAIKSPMKAAFETGDVVDGDAGPDHEFRQATFRGDTVPGVVLRVPTRKTFSIHANKENQDDHDG